jgi:hypothetical protein
MMNDMITGLIWIKDVNSYESITGTKSTVCALRILSHEKNFLKDYDENVSVNYYNEIGKYKDVIIKVEKNTDMTMKLYNANIPTSCSVAVRKYSNPTQVLTTFNQGSTGDIANTFNTSDEDKIILRYYNGANSPITYDKAQLELGTSATTWKKYDESVSYIYAIDENGNIIKLNSLPNGTKDVVSVVKGEWYKNISSDLILQGSTDWNNYYALTNVDVVRSRALENVIFTANNQASIRDMTYITNAVDNVDNIGKYYLSGSHLYIVVEKGLHPLSWYQDSLNWSATLNYQLATPITYKNGENGFLIEGTLFAYKNGTIIVEPYHKKELTYNTASGGLVFDNPITSIEKIKKIVNGSYQEITFTPTIASTGLSATIAELVDGDVVTVYALYRPEESTVPTTSYKVSLNRSSQIDSNTIIGQKNSEAIVDLKDILDILLRM